MADVTQRWRSERLMAAIYEAGVRHDRVATVGARAMWGADMRRMFADVTALQFDDAHFDLCLTYNGLHCLPDPRAALGELTRILRPGGTLRGTSCVTGRGLRKDALIAGLRRIGAFGNTPHTGDIETWLTEFGLDVVTLERSGAIEFFEARLPRGEQTD